MVLAAIAADLARGHWEAAGAAGTRHGRKQHSPAKKKPDRRRATIGPKPHRSRWRAAGPASSTGPLLSTGRNGAKEPPWGETTT
jgi:hypothetical protein